MKYLVIIIVAVIPALVYDSVNLRVANRDHVRAYAEIESIESVYKCTYKQQVHENNTLKNELHGLQKKIQSLDIAVKHRDAEIASKDVKIKKLFQAIVKLYQIIRQQPKKQDRVT